MTLGCMLVWTLIRQKLQPGPGIPQSAREKELAAIPSLSSAHALHLTHSLLKAKDPAELRGLIRTGSISAAQAIDILNSMRESEGEPTPPTWIGSADAFAAPIELLYCRFGPLRHYIIPLTPDETGRWQIDFDAMIRHCEPEFRRIADGSADRGVVRAVVKESDYFNAPFTSDTEWRCFVISDTSPEIPQLYGYFKKGSTLELVMEQVLTRYRRQMLDAGAEAPLPTPGEPTGLVPSALQPEMRLTLRIHRPGDAQHNQFLIDEVLSDEWVVGRASVQNILRDGNGGDLEPQ